MKRSKTYPLRLKVNGVVHKLRVQAHRTLLEVLREDLGLTGAKEGCGRGECGSCTVIIGGRPVKSCIFLALQAEGEAITTIEGLAQEKTLDPLQRAFIDHGAIQCGFCTPGMILTARTLLAGRATPREEEIRDYLSGNLCRCTGYQKIVQAIQAVAGEGEKK